MPKIDDNLIPYNEDGNEMLKPVTCLGIEFENDKARRDYFTNLLREKLKEADFKKTDGFPRAADEDILALSDPPYYTACPNPWVQDFIKQWEQEKTRDSTKPYHREPFAADVSEGKNDPIYNAHSYHTKVPHKAIMRYILHYTEPGDIVFDGFCGTGMTGVAAQMCGSRNDVLALGYQIKPDGTIINEEGKPFSKLGVRKSVLNDLSPAATFIAYNYNSPVDIQKFRQEAERVLDEVEQEYGWMYETLHTDGKGIGKINYTVWSDVFICSECSREIIFWEAAVDKDAGKVREIFSCPYCKTQLKKRGLERAFINKYDKHIDSNEKDASDKGSGIKEKGAAIKQAKQVPVLINYTVGKKRFEKIPDKNDLALIQKIEESDIPYWFPTERMPDGDESRRNDSAGITHTHHFYTKRNLWTLAKLWKRFSNIQSNTVMQMMRNFITATQINLDVRYAYRENGKGGIVKGTLYIPSFSQENSVFQAINNKYNRFITAISSKQSLSSSKLVISQHSSTDLRGFKPESLDYIFTDPPFGSNLMYSELSFLWEAWLKVFTNNQTEAIENKVQGKGLAEYQSLMTDCFKEYFRVLKPGRWMTVEFHNSKNSIWNSIQEALQIAGFVVADVRVLDKQQGSFKQVTTASAVKQDLIISCYKPNGGLEERFIREADTEEGVWDFVCTHLRQLPLIVADKGKLQINTERQNYLLYDRMVAFYVQRSVMVPLSSGEFYKGLEQKFPVRDSMYFLPEQVVEYDKKRLSVTEIDQTQIFITNEASAIQWLKGILNEKPQTYQEIHPLFTKELAGWSKFEKKLELSLLLEQNFLCYDGKGDVPNKIHSYLSSNWKELRNLPKGNPQLKAKAKDRWYVPDYNKLADILMIREKALLREFWTYLPEGLKRKKKEDEQIQLSFKDEPAPQLPIGKRFKIIRLEAVRIGFRNCWQNRDYETIIAVAKRIPSNVLEEDPKLLMYYDQAITRMGGD